MRRSTIAESFTSTDFHIRLMAAAIPKWLLQAELMKRGRLDNDPAAIERAVIDHQ
jgi:hypothetical protein